MSCRRLAGSFVLNRKGYTLIEVLAVLTVMLIVAVSAAKMLGAVTDFGVNSRLKTQARQDIARLANQFRRDVQASNDFSVDESIVLLKMDDGSEVSYKIGRDRSAIFRTVSMQSKESSFDKFSLASHCDPSFKQSDRLVVVET